MNQQFGATFNARQYSSQVVDGTNYRIKYDIGLRSQLTVQVYQPLQGSNVMPSVTGIIDDGYGNSYAVEANQGNQASESNWKNVGPNSDRDSWMLFNTWQGLVEVNTGYEFADFNATKYKETEVDGGSDFEIEYNVQNATEQITVKIFEPKEH